TFDFLGYGFRPRRVKSARNTKVFCGFNPAVSASALKSMREKIRDLNIRRRTHVTMAEIARQLNPILRGWIEYYGRYTPSALLKIFQYVDQTLRLDDAEIQALQGAQSPDVARSRPVEPGTCRTLRTLAIR